MGHEKLTGSFISVTTDQTRNPPGGDRSLGAFYGAVLTSIDQKTELAAMVARVQHSRHGITDQHLVNLLFRAVQATEMYASDPDLSYSSYTKPDQWMDRLTKLLADSQKSATLEGLLTTQNTTTTIYQRYAGPFAFMNYYFGDKPITVVDVGCGGNFGLRGLEFGIPFNKIEDHTPDSLVNKYLELPTNLQQGYALDRENPDDPEVRKWRRACSFYPGELGNLAAYDQFEQQISQSQKVQFVKADLLDIKTDLGIPKSDAAILSTVLYQYSRRDQQFIIDMVRDKLLTPEGVLIVQDFGSPDLDDPTKFAIEHSWFAKDYSYRTLVCSAATNWEFQEVFEWKNGRCKEVRAGHDFAKVFGLKYTSPEVTSSDITQRPELFIRAKVKEAGILAHTVENFDYRVKQAASFMVRMMERGMPYHQAYASLELMIRKHLDSYVPPFQVDRFDGEGINEADFPDTMLIGSMRINFDDGRPSENQLFGYKTDKKCLRLFCDSLIYSLSRFYPGLSYVHLYQHDVRKTPEGKCVSITLRNGNKKWTTAYLSDQESTATVYAMTEALQYAVSQPLSQTL